MGWRFRVAVPRVLSKNRKNRYETSRCAANFPQWNQWSQWKPRSFRNTCDICIDGERLAGILPGIGRRCRPCTTVSRRMTRMTSLRMTTTTRCQPRRIPANPVQWRWMAVNPGKKNFSGVSRICAPLGTSFNHARSGLLGERSRKARWIFGNFPSQSTGLVEEWQVKRKGRLSYE